MSVRVEHAPSIGCLIADDHPRDPLIEQLLPTVAVIDVRMDGMDGIRIVRRLDERERSDTNGRGPHGHRCCDGVGQLGRLRQSRR